MSRSCGKTLRVISAIGRGAFPMFHLVWHSKSTRFFSECVEAIPRTHIQFDWRLRHIRFFISPSPQCNVDARRGPSLKHSTRQAICCPLSDGVSTCPPQPQPSSPRPAPVCLHVLYCLIILVVSLERKVAAAWYLIVGTVLPYTFTAFSASSFPSVSFSSSLRPDI